MNRLTTLLLACVLAVSARANRPDSLYLFAYNSEPARGLSLAYSSDGKAWTPLAGRHTVVGSDYGAWGSQKKMHDPFLLRHGSQWVLVFAVNDREPVFAICTSPDLSHWKPQDYPRMDGVRQCLHPVVTTTDAGGVLVCFRNSEGRWFRTSSADACHFSGLQVCQEPDDPRVTVVLDGISRTGTVSRIAATELDAILAFKALGDQRGARNAENLRDDSRFHALRESPLHATITPDAAAAKPISDKLIGIFFEDINYSADGGLYAELVQNRDFEYSASDRGREQNWSATNSWSVTGDGATFDIAEDEPLHPNQAHYAILTTTAAGGALVNDGFDGIVVRRGETYDVSLFARQAEGKASRLVIELRDAGRVIASTTLAAPSSQWKQLSGSLRATADADAASLAVCVRAEGRVALDLVSLFPRKTYKGRRNGMRADLAQVLEDLHPRFMRFPGGCVAHGDGLHNIYNWKETIGPIHERKGARNLWGYHQTRGLGYYEFFLLCEDLGCEPLPVVAAGVPCQNSSDGGGGQQGGIPMGPEMAQYVQDVLDLIEWANGDPKTSEWARKRAEAGHPKPFNLKYIGIGNEDLISETFAERYLMIIRAVKARYPEIQVCGTVGPFFEGADYEQGWRLAKDNKIDMVDEHYYVSPAWYVHNQDYYDLYDRSASKVYLGEYASHGQGRKSTIETALTCAMHVCNLERNGDVVAMSSYAPLLAKNGHTQWNPDLIYFDNKSVYPTVDYWAQLLCGQSQGDTYVPSDVAFDGDVSSDVRSRIAVSTVRDTRSGRTYVKIVNLLPAATTATLDLAAMPAAATTATLQCLSGSLDDQKARPAAPQTIGLKPQTELTLPPYSFTVVAF